jgi:hypothetical protein
MAGTVLVRGVLVLMGLTADGATAMIDDGLSTWEELSLQTDDDIESVCKSISKPGGGEDGTTIAHTAESNVKLLCYYLRHQKRRSLAPVHTNMMLVTIRRLRSLRDQEKDHKEPKAPGIDAKDWPRTIEAIEEYLAECLGVTKIPLAYVIRESIEPVAAPATGWPTHQHEMIDRAPIVVNAQAVPLVYIEHYMTDNTTVWTKIAAMTRDHECWTYVRSFLRAKDGRAAFKALHMHYLGVNNVDTLSTNAWSKLNNTRYSGEKRNFTFERYVRIHTDQHAILKGLEAHGHHELDERSKVRLLMNGIKTSALDTVRATILGNPAMRSDFIQASGLYKDFIDQMNTDKKDREIMIAAVGTGGKPGPAPALKKGVTVKPDMSVEDRYYTKEEYASMSPAKKYGLKLKRSSRNATDTKKKAGSKSKVTLSKRSIKALASELSAATTADGADSESSSEASEEELPMKPPASKKLKIKSNRTNPALRRGE